MSVSPRDPTARCVRLCFFAIGQCDNSFYVDLQEIDTRDSLSYSGSKAGMHTACTPLAITLRAMRHIPRSTHTAMRIN